MIGGDEPELPANHSFQWNFHQAFRRILRHIIPGKKAWREIVGFIPGFDLQFSTSVNILDFVKGNGTVGVIQTLKYTCNILINNW